MDTEDFLLKRRPLLERLDARRSKDLSAYPFRMGGAFGLKLPVWARWALSLAPGGGLVSKLMQIGLPLAIPFFFKREPPLLNRILARFFPSKA